MNLLWRKRHRFYLCWTQSIARLKKNGQKNMTNQNNPSYNTIPHYVAKDYRSGKLAFNERNLLLWLRAIGDPYGVATTSLSDLRDDVFPKLKKNTANAVLLKLLQKHYIFYELRQGKTGTFDIHLNHWMMPKGGYKTLDKFFSSDEQEIGKESKSSNEGARSLVSPPKGNQKLGVQNQKLVELKSQLINKVSASSDSQQIRSYHNEHDTEHQIETYDTLAKIPFKGGTSVRDFHPKNHEEERCKEMAVELREEFINPLLSVLRKNGLRRLERAWGIFCEHKAEGKKMDSPARYFQGILKNLGQPI